MKLLFFGEDYRLGVSDGTKVVDVTDIARDVPHAFPQELIRGVIERFEQYRARFEEVLSRDQGTPLSQVRIRSPLPKPTHLACMSVNYLDGTRDEMPGINAFLKSPLGVIGDGDTMVLQDIPSTVFEGEAELAVVIGKYAEEVSADEAMDYVFGYTNFIDGSARGLPADGSNVQYQMKARATFAPIGPFIVTKDEIPHPNNLIVRQWNNEELKQEYSTKDLYVKIPECIEFITSIHPLEAGDILALGTNHNGLHAYQDGDLIEQECEGLGRLHIRIRDDLKRRWGRETRRERVDRGLGAPRQLTGKYSTS